MPAPALANLLRRLPLVLILCAAAVGFFTLRDHLDFAGLARHREALLAFRDAHTFWSTIVFITTYIIIVSFSLPGSLVATLTGGFLFGLFPGALYNIGAASVGAIMVFLAVRVGLGAEVARKIEQSGGAAARLQAALRENEIPVLLMMRLVPVVPFFVANLIPAFVGTSLSRFALTTVVGIIPGGVIYTSVGAGLGEVFARGESPDLSIVFEPHILGPVLGLAALAALPIILKMLRKRGV